MLSTLAKLALKIACNSSEQELNFLSQCWINRRHARFNNYNPLVRKASLDETRTSSPDRRYGSYSVIEEEILRGTASKKSITLEEPAAQRILSALLREFREKGFGTEELRDEYQGLSPAVLKSTCCADGKISDVDFELAMNDLDADDLVKTGPTALYDNPPNSSVLVVAFYSKNEYSYLTEEGYKAATRLAVTRPPRIPVPSVHISGGTFHQSPIGVGTKISQTVNISASSDELFSRLREEIQEHVSDDKKRSEIMVHLDALENAQGQPSMFERYTQLVGVVGDHVTVFGPLLALLLQKLMGH